MVEPSAWTTSSSRSGWSPSSSGFSSSSLAAYPGNGSDLVDWKPTRDYETEIQLEQDDIAQMIAAQNDYRRRRGARELTERDAERMAREDQRVRQRGRMDEESLAKLDRDLRHEPDPAREDGNG